MGSYVFNTLDIGASTSGASDASRFLVSSPNLSNSMGLSFFGTSDSYPGIKNLWERSENQVEANAVETGYTSSMGTKVPGFVPEGAEIISSTATEEIAEEGGILAGEVAADIGAGPAGIALLVNQQLGNAVTSAMSAATEDQINSDNTQNLSQHGMNVDLNAGMIKSNQEATRQNQESGASIGSMFGPLGALIGHSIAGVVSANPSLFQTAGSFLGPVNPTDTGIAMAQTTDAMTNNSTMVDNVTS